VYKDAPFQNWGLDIHFLPIYTCIPTTVGAIQRIVRYAKQHDLGVRCAGFGKSLSLFPHNIS
jgi:FAD/FMN-containing dehydrogenase